MAIDTHIKFDGVEGEATHVDHKGEIDVLSWKWDVSNVSGAGKAGGSGQGKAQPGNFVFSHNYDKASPVLAKNCASGKHFATVVLTARKAGALRVAYGQPCRAAARLHLGWACAERHPTARAKIPSPRPT